MISFPRARGGSGSPKIARHSAIPTATTWLKYVYNKREVRAERARKINKTGDEHQNIPLPLPLPSPPKASPSPGETLPLVWQTPSLISLFRPGATSDKHSYRLIRNWVGCVLRLSLRILTSIQRILFHRRSNKIENVESYVLIILTLAVKFIEVVTIRLEMIEMGIFAFIQTS